MPDRNGVACVVSPNAADLHIAVSFLADNGIEALGLPSLLALATALDERFGCIILVEEALAEEHIPALRDALSRLPPWSDIPLIVVSRDASLFGSITSNAFPDSGNVTLLERPLNPHSLVSAVQVALRATNHQRQLAELITQREHDVKLRDEFLAMLAHELRNPLAPMRNSLYMMRMLKDKDPMALKNIEILERQVNHVVRMVDDLMDVARLERGKVVLQKKSVDLNQAVSAAVEGCLPAARERRHQITMHFASGALPAQADDVRIEQIVSNLVTNALKFSRPSDEIRVETLAEDDCAVIRVQDKGIGFEPGTAETLFDPFLQANPTIERSTGGLGLGLTIVRRLAELHGGSVRASSEGPGKGSCFEVRIPMAEPPPEQRLETSRPADQPKRRRVVVIEDNPDIRETFRMLMTMWGHEVFLAEDGPAGVDCVLRMKPDVAFVDVGLPQMNGYEVARALRKATPSGGPRLVAVTGYGQPSDRKMAFDAGFDAHLLKPVMPETLEKLLAE